MELAFGEALNQLKGQSKAKTVEQGANLALRCESSETERENMKTEKKT